jgi:hypothetical protein
MDPEGIVVGSNDGMIVGSNDGCNVIEGPLLGCRDGLFEGWLLIEGAVDTDGCNDGCNVIEGPLLGCRDGLFEG